MQSHARVVAICQYEYFLQQCFGPKIKILLFSEEKKKTWISPMFVRLVQKTEPPQSANYRGAASQSDDLVATPR